MVNATRRFRRRHTVADPGRAMLERAAAKGYITPQQAVALDEWAGDLATKLCRGELSPSEFEAEIAKRAHADAARRGKA
jgi:hypothetical protein